MRRYSFILLLLYAFWGARVTAHPVSVLKGKAAINNQELSVELRIFPEDFTFFQGVRSDKEGYFARAAMLEAQERHREFLSKHLYVLDHKGRRLETRISVYGNIKFQSKGLHVSQLMEQEIAYQIKVSLKDKPRALTIYQKLGGGTRIPALLDLQIPGAPGEIQGFRLNNGGNPRSLILSWHHDMAHIKVPRVRGVVAEVSAAGEGAGKILIKIPAYILHSVIPLSNNQEQSFLVSSLEVHKKLIAEKLAGSLKLRGEKGKPVSLSVADPELRDLAGKLVSLKGAEQAGIFAHEIWVEAGYRLLPGQKVLSASWTLFNDHIREAEVRFTGFDVQNKRAFFTPYKDSLVWPVQAAASS